jgi:hypothetical protein
MRKQLTLLLLLVTFLTNGQLFRAIKPVEPIKVAKNGNAFTTLVEKKLISGNVKYYYVKSDSTGKLAFIAYRYGDIFTDLANVTVPVNFTAFVNCGFSDRLALGGWNITPESPTILRRFNEDWWAVQQQDGSFAVDQFMVRGKNYLLNDHTITYPFILEPACYNQLANQVTGLDGLNLSTNFATPSGYEIAGETYRRINSQDGGNGTGSGTRTFYAQEETDGKRDYNGAASYTRSLITNFSNNVLSITNDWRETLQYSFGFGRPNKYYSGSPTVRNFDVSEFNGYPLQLYAFQDPQTATDAVGTIYQPKESDNLFGWWSSTLYIPPTDASDIPAFMDFSDRPNSNKYLFDERFPDFTPPAGVSVMTEARKEAGVGTINVPIFSKGITHSRNFATKSQSFLFSYDEWVNDLGGGSLGNPQPNYDWIINNADATAQLNASWNNRHGAGDDIVFLDGESFNPNFATTGSQTILERIGASFGHIRTRHPFLAYWTKSPYVAKFDNNTTAATFRADYNITSLSGLISSGRGGTFWQNNNWYSNAGQHLNLWSVGRYSFTPYDSPIYEYVQQLEVLNQVRTNEKIIGFFWHTVELLPCTPEPCYDIPAHKQWFDNNGNAYWKRIKPNAPPSLLFNQSVWSVFNKASVFYWDNPTWSMSDNQANWGEFAKRGVDDDLPNEYGTVNGNNFVYDENSHRQIDWGMFGIYQTSQTAAKEIIEGTQPILRPTYIRNGVTISGNNLFPNDAFINKLPLVRIKKHPSSNTYLILAMNELAGGLDVETITVNLPNGTTASVKLKGQWTTVKVQ